MTHFLIDEKAIAKKKKKEEDRKEKLKDIENQILLFPDYELPRELE